MLKQMRNPVTGLFLVLSLILLGIESDGSDSTGTKTLVGDGGWTQLVDQQVIGDQGNTVPVAQAKSYFTYNSENELTSIDGVAGYGTFFISKDVTLDIDLLFFKWKETITLSDTWVGGQVADFSFDGTATTLTWQRDLHRDIDSASNNPVISLLETKQYDDKKIHWVALTAEKKVIYYHYSVLNVDTETIDQDTHSGNIQMIDVKFPDSGLPKDLKLLTFYDDGNISYYNGQKWQQLSVPVGNAGFFSKSVNWESTTEIPKMVVGHINGLVSYYPGSGTDWTNLNDPGNTNALVKVNWADSENSEIVVGFGDGQIFYKKGLEDSQGWVAVAIWPFGAAVAVARMEVSFAVTTNPRNTTYPQIVSLFWNGSILYFNGNDEMQWHVIEDIWVPTKYGGLFSYANGLSVNDWPNLEKDTTEYTKFPQVVAFKSLSRLGFDLKKWSIEQITTSSLDYYKDGEESKKNLYYIQDIILNPDLKHLTLDGKLILDADYGWDANGNLKNVVTSMQSGIVQHTAIDSSSNGSN